ncbi:MAG: protein kinase domain-containing protein, partial [Gemmatimonadales bacterium]
MNDLQARLTAALADHYTIDREAGRGGMSIVYRARDRRLDRWVALKVLRPELSATLGAERFLREIKLAARLKHPYILKLHESGEAAGALYYVMPYVEGESLRQRLVREGMLPVAEALRIGHEVAEALDYAHRQNVVHRDIKPENILFEEGHALVSDFGIARAISAAGERDTGTGVVLGTVDYMSPEQEQGRREIDGRTDVYSLGVVLYEMLVGETPGPDRGVDSLTGRRPDVPTAVVRVIRRAVARDSAERFASAGELGRALAAAGRASGMRRLGRLPWRPRWVGMSGVVLVAAGAWLWARRDAPPPLDPTHIAVLYFDDLSPDSSLGAVAAGLTEDVIDRLAQVSALRVISPNGVRPFRGRAVPPDSVAHALGVGTIVSGSVTRSGNLLRVSVRMVDGTTSRLLYTRQVGRAYGELFALQDTITADIATFLRQRIGETIVLRERRAGTSSVEAWELVRRGDGLRDDARALERDGNDAAASAVLWRADSLYARAHAIDRRWSVPLVGRGRVAQAFAVLLAEARTPAEVRAALRRPLPERPRYEDEWIRAARAAVERALAQAPGHADALELRGSLRYLWWLRGYATNPDSLRAAAADLRAAVTAEPGLARGWARLSQLLRFTGRFAEAEQAAQQALEADAFLLEARPVYMTLYFAALNLERYDDARRWCTRARARFPTDVEFAHCALRILGWSGRGRAAITRAWRLVDSLGAAGGGERTGVWAADRRLMLAALYARSGQPD